MVISDLFSRARNIFGDKSVIVINIIYVDNNGRLAIRGVLQVFHICYSRVIVYAGIGC